MSRVLLVGNDGSSTMAGDGGGACIARTKSFHAALARGDHDVDVCSPVADLSAVRTVGELLAKKSYDCLVTISPHPAELSVLTGTSLPMWIDMHGMHPAEVHLSGDPQGEPRLEMIRILSLQNTLLSRGDCFSAPSLRQTCAIMGELYLLGRLDAISRKIVPAKAIPHCAMEAPVSAGPPEGSDVFSIISTGSFNSWFDGDTLFEALEYAMARNPHITFTATGGAVPFAQEQYASFRKRVLSSRMRQRYRLAGWVEKEELERIQSNASAAVYTDIPSGETLLGARTRVLDWVSREIPVICTLGAEISETIASRGLGIAVPQGSPEDLGDAILKLAGDKALSERIKRSQKKWKEGEGSLSSVFSPLLEWCSNPTILPRKQLCDPTVSRVSSPSYRRMVLKEISSVSGSSEALRFLWGSLIRKICGKS